MNALIDKVNYERRQNMIKFKILYLMIILTLIFVAGAYEPCKHETQFMMPQGYINSCIDQIESKCICN